MSDKVWVLFSPGGETATIEAAYTDPTIAAETETVIADSIFWLEEITVQSAPPRTVEWLELVCYLNPAGDIDSAYFQPWDKVHTFYMVTPEAEPLAPAGVDVRHSRTLMGGEPIRGGRVYVKALGSDFPAVRAAFAAEIEIVRAEMKQT